MARTTEVLECWYGRLAYTAQIEKWINGGGICLIADDPGQPIRSGVVPGTPRAVVAHDGISGSAPVLDLVTEDARALARRARSHCPVGIGPRPPGLQTRNGHDDRTWRSRGFCHLNCQVFFIPGPRPRGAGRKPKTRGSSVVTRHCLRTAIARIWNVLDDTPASDWGTRSGQSESSGGRRARGEPRRDDYMSSDGP
jgi:hypothetical protein